MIETSRYKSVCLQCERILHVLYVSISINQGPLFADEALSVDEHKIRIVVHRGA